jgi:hypothetical protein
MNRESRGTAGHCRPSAPCMIAAHHLHPGIASSARSNLLPFATPSSAPRLNRSILGRVLRPFLRALLHSPRPGFPFRWAMPPEAIALRIVDL